MNWWLFAVLPLDGWIGWVFASLGLRWFFHPVRPVKLPGFRLQGLISARWPELASAAGRLAAGFFSIDELEGKITHPDNVKMIMPHAEAHIDQFLRVKLVKSMPVVGMFVGDKTINHLKTLFIAELEQLFPEIMQQYMQRLRADVDIEQLVTEKLAAVPSSRIEEILTVGMKREFRLIRCCGAILGLVIGFIQLVIGVLIMRYFHTPL